MEIPVEAFRVSDQNMFGALRALRSTNPSRILIGFESIPARRDEEQYRISLELTDKSVKYVLHQLIQRDPRYTYELTGSQLVNIYPKNAKEDPDDLLLVVRGDSRREGIGRQLMGFAERKVARQGANIYASVPGTSTAAQQFFERLGPK